jgi:hypothetical protein
MTADLRQAYAERFGLEAQSVPPASRARPERPPPHPCPRGAPP